MNNIDYLKNVSREGWHLIKGQKRYFIISGFVLYFGVILVGWILNPLRQILTEPGVKITNINGEIHYIYNIPNYMLETFIMQMLSTPTVLPLGVATFLFAVKIALKRPPKILPLLKSCFRHVPSFFVILFIITPLNLLLIALAILIPVPSTTFAFLFIKGLIYLILFPIHVLINFVYLLCVDRNITAIPAIKRSIKPILENLPRLYFVIFITHFIFLIGIILTLSIGAIWLFPWLIEVYAILYRDIFYVKKSSSLQKIILNKGS